MTGEPNDNLPRTLRTTLESFLDLVQCDAGSVFTVRKDQLGEPVLQFETMVTRSMKLCGVPAPLRSLQFKINDASIVGKTAAHRKSIVLNGLHDKQNGSARVARVLEYTTRNIFSGPLVTPRGDLVGVVQLLNKLPKDPSSFQANGTSALPDFNERDERLFSIIVGQVALAIENSILLQEQERLMEGFVGACVTAIEARDPVTSGHSMRVAMFTVGLAEAVNRTDTGPLRDLVFTPAQLRELRFASMLHDIGKIGVKEEVLQKKNKLLPHELDIISMRLKLMRAQMIMSQHKEKNSRYDVSFIERALRKVVEINEPAIVSRPASDIVTGLRSLHVPMDTGEVLTALTEEEAQKLSLPKGSLSELERIEIESHVDKTLEILKMIPWSRGLEQVPEIASKHHEHLDGSGYPRHITAEHIPYQTRLMTICDIYDALRADDRPYKPAMSAEHALNVIAVKVSEGKLDGDCFDVFLQAKIYDLAEIRSRTAV
jgi:HD-GYP domain-containing protein (c-di-GMP phosphodiesterase class II)